MNNLLRNGSAINEDGDEEDVDTRVITKDKDNFSTVRNVKQMKDSWRLKMPKYEIQKVQDQCADVITRMGLDIIDVTEKTDDKSEL